MERVLIPGHLPQKGLWDCHTHAEWLSVVLGKFSDTELRACTWKWSEHREMGGVWNLHRTLAAPPLVWERAVPSCASVLYQRITAIHLYQLFSPQVKSLATVSVHFQHLPTLANLLIYQREGRCQDRYLFKHHYLVKDVLTLFFPPDWDLFVNVPSINIRSYCFPIYSSNVVSFLNKGV